jgi:xanthine dehydrogenase large subunit
MKGKGVEITNQTPSGNVTGLNIDAENHVRGKSIFVDDFPVMEGTLYAKAYTSNVSHGTIKNINWSQVEQHTGVVKIISNKDIIGENQIGGIIQDEPLLADSDLHFWGQPILIIVAESEKIATDALKLVEIEIIKKEAIVDPREAYMKGKTLAGSRTFESGNIHSAFDKCDHIYEGTAEIGGQEHLYLETQGAYGYPLENGGLKIYSSTQGPTQVQRAVAKVTGLSMNKIEIDVTRLGGGFGGKEDQANAWAAIVAVACQITQKPVKYILHRMEDMRMTGKRHPYSVDYKIGLDNSYKIQAYEATFYQNGGAATDLSPAVLERTLFHANNAYFIPNMKVTAHCCKTNLPPNTAFRGFGGPQGMFAIEAGIDLAASKIGIDAHIIQRKNLLADNNEFHYGQKVENSEAISCWDKLVDTSRFKNIEEDIKSFNKTNTYRKKGLAFMPICFGISFTNTQMNNARALVHVYSDGSIGVSTGAVEMGQGVNSKLSQVAQFIFGVFPDKVKIESTNTTRVANTSPSAASSTTDLNGKALEIACHQIFDRLKNLVKNKLGLSKEDIIGIKEETIIVNGVNTNLGWKALISLAFGERINLSAKGHYATPMIHFDKTTEKGHPFAYHVYGTALIVSEIDCLRGIYEIDAVHVVHDFGSSMNRKVDLGQCEGGIVQGIGWMTMEELIFNNDGRLLSNALSTYKVPDIYSVPKEINIHFLQTDGSEYAVLKSKAVGEPPLMYGIGSYFSLKNAIRSFNPNADIPYDSPMTPEKVLMNLYQKPKNA